MTGELDIENTSPVYNGSNKRKIDMEEVVLLKKFLVGDGKHDPHVLDTPVINESESENDQTPFTSQENKGPPDFG